jgi:hypothetical protein
MLFFDDKLLLKYSGFTGSFLAIDRADIACDAVYNAVYNASLDDSLDADAAYHAAHNASRDASRYADAAWEHAKPFKSFKSLSETALSALSIVSAPLLLTLLALDEMLSFIVSSLKSIYNFATSKPGEAKELGEEAVGHLLNAFNSLLAAAVSPVVNAVDFAGSCVTTLTTGTDENPETLSAMNP